MSHRKPRKGELNYELERLIFDSFARAKKSTVKALPLLEAELKKLPKKWGIRETMVTYETELTPKNENWKPGPMMAFVEMIMILAYRYRANGTIAEHKVCFNYWPKSYTWPVEYKGNREIINPVVHSCVDDPYHEISVLKKKKKK